MSHYSGGRACTAAAHSESTTRFLEMGFKFKFPSACTVIGASQSGKTTLMRNIISNIDRLFEVPIDIIYWFYAIDNDGIPRDCPKVMAISGLPDMNLIKAHKGKNAVLVLDDLQSHFSRDKSGKELLNDIFCVYAHHLKFAVFNLIQSAFLLDRTSRINSTYIILLKNHADKMQVRTILIQQFGEGWRAALEAYDDAMEKPYSHLLIDSHPLTDKQYRILSNITSPQPIVYVARN